ncbi:hypothetical protein GJA_4891 [Janthinobacterium agaricidamnosum NBRC 102515 = DSM 9628]|uniref:Uncharacterized protein n=1 Tax=Janthinobacterium agaricidamnosum NBRC 102515 = DSM 9628 TaxID=1349767 RepID=W0V9L0_9BURK|nr:hypothetical protein GJA_4891 [Janthinobacterium agaricidamnosum NBRC 102515 = DSM 9628]
MRRRSRGRASRDFRRHDIGDTGGDTRRGLARRLVGGNWLCLRCGGAHRHHGGQSYNGESVFQRTFLAMRANTDSTPNPPFACFTYVTKYLTNC